MAVGRVDDFNFYDTSDPQYKDYNYLDRDKFQSFLDGIAIPEEFAVLEKGEKVEAVRNYLFNLMDRGPDRFYVHGIHDHRLEEAFNDKITSIENELLRVDPDAEVDRRLNNWKSALKEIEEDEYSARNGYRSIHESIYFLKKALNTFSLTLNPELETELKVFESNILLSACKIESGLRGKVIDEYLIKPDAYLLDKFQGVDSSEKLGRRVDSDNNSILDARVLKEGEELCLGEDKEVLKVLLDGLNEKMAALWDKINTLRENQDLVNNKANKE